MAGVLVTETTPGYQLRGAARFLSGDGSLEPEPYLEPAKFDEDAAISLALEMVASRRLHDTSFCESHIPHPMSYEAAVFWFEAFLIISSNHAPTREEFQKWQQMPPNYLERFHQNCGNSYNVLPQLYSAIFASLFGPVEFLKQLADGKFLFGEGTYWNRHNIEPELIRGAWRFVRPYLNTQEISEIRGYLRPKVDVSLWPKIDKAPNPTAFWVAAMMGMNAELQALVRTWTYAPGDLARDITRSHIPQLILMGTNDSKLISKYTEHFDLPMASFVEFKCWLHHLQAHGIPAAMTWLERGSNPETIAALQDTTDPVLAPHMLHWKLHFRDPAPGRIWLEKNIGAGVTGLLPMFAKRGKLADTVKDYLISVCEQGYESLITNELPKLPKALQDKVRRHILERPKPVDTPTECREPEWAKEYAGIPDSMPSWVNLPLLPPLTTAGVRLPDAVVAGMISDVRAQEDVTKSITWKIRKQMDTASGDRFAIAHFERFLAEKIRWSENWVIRLMGLIGGNGVVDLFMKRMTRWSGGSGSRRQVEAVDAIQYIETDYAIIHLRHLVDHHHDSDIRRQAKESLTKITSRSRLDSRKIDDKAVPSLGLQSETIYSYGERKFQLKLGANLQAHVQEFPAGRVTTVLPSLRKTDDVNLAAVARDEFTAVKHRIQEVSRILAKRWEHTYIDRHSWSMLDFSQVVLNHPIAHGLSQRVLWRLQTGVPTENQFFRITSEGDFADISDRPMAKPAPQARIMVAHSLEMSASEREGWTQHFRDYEIIPAFRQLDRPFIQLSEAETQQREYTGFASRQVPLTNDRLNLLRKHHWVRRSACLEFDLVSYKLLAKLFYTGRGVIHCEKFYFYSKNKTLDAEERNVMLRDIDPVLRSEILCQVDELTRVETARV
ncbi:MAG: DUF4132 domain-containing protein [Fimbriiglobus sp.]